MLLRLVDEKTSSALFRPQHERPVLTIDGFLPTIQTLAGFLQIGYGQPLAMAVINLATTLTALAKVPGCKLRDNVPELFKICDALISNAYRHPSLAPLNPWAPHPDLEDRLKHHFTVTENSPEVKAALARIQKAEDDTTNARLARLEQQSAASPQAVGASSGNSRRSRNRPSSAPPATRASARSHAQPVPSVQPALSNSASTLTKQQWHDARPTFLDYADVPCYGWALKKGNCATSQQPCPSNRPHKWSRNYTTAQKKQIMTWLQKHPIHTGVQWAPSDPTVA